MAVGGDSSPDGDAIHIMVTIVTYTILCIWKLLSRILKFSSQGKKTSEALSGDGC